MNAETRIKPEWVVERQGKPVILYAGLIALAHEDGLRSIRTQLLQVPAEENERVAIVSAEVQLADGRTFSGIGDASPRNVARPMVEATIRFAETRAKARALRDAVNIGLVALEELPDEDESTPRQPIRPTPGLTNGKWAAIWNPWTALVTEARALGVPDAALTDITPELGQEAIKARVIEVKALVEKARTLSSASSAPTSASSAPTSASSAAPAASSAAPAASSAAASGPAATTAQVKAIYAVGGTEAKLKATGVDEISQGRYGALPAELTKRQASELLDHLRTLGRPVADEELPF